MQPHDHVHDRVDGPVHVGCSACGRHKQKKGSISGAPPAPPVMRTAGSQAPAKPRFVRIEDFEAVIAQIRTEFDEQLASFKASHGDRMMGALMKCNKCDDCQSHKCKGCNAHLLTLRGCPCEITGCYLPKARESSFCALHSCPIGRSTVKDPHITECKASKEATDPYCASHTCASAGCRTPNLPNPGSSSPSVHCQRHRCRVVGCTTPTPTPNDIGMGLCAPHTCAVAQCGRCIHAADEEAPNTDWKSPQHCAAHACWSPSCDAPADLRAVPTTHLCSAHRCRDPDCPDAAVGGPFIASTTGGPLAERVGVWCPRHTCQRAGCPHRTARSGARFCWQHTCVVASCSNEASEVVPDDADADVVPLPDAPRAIAVAQLCDVHRCVVRGCGRIAVCETAHCDAHAYLGGAPPAVHTDGGAPARRRRRPPLETQHALFPSHDGASGGGTAGAVEDESPAAGGAGRRRRRLRAALAEAADADSDAAGGAGGAGAGVGRVGDVEPTNDHLPPTGDAGAPSGLRPARRDAAPKAKPRKAPPTRPPTPRVGHGSLCAAEAAATIAARLRRSDKVARVAAARGVGAAMAAAAAATSAVTAGAVTAPPAGGRALVRAKSAGGRRRYADSGADIASFSDDSDGDVYLPASGTAPLRVGNAARGSGAAAVALVSRLYPTPLLPPGAVAAARAASQSQSPSPHPATAAYAVQPEDFGREVRRVLREAHDVIPHAAARGRAAARPLSADAAARLDELAAPRARGAASSESPGPQRGALASPIVAPRAASAADGAGWPGYAAAAPPTMAAATAPPHPHSVAELLLTSGVRESPSPKALLLGAAAARAHVPLGAGVVGGAAAVALSEGFYSNPSTLVTPETVAAALRYHRGQGRGLQPLEQ